MTSKAISISQSSFLEPRGMMTSSFGPQIELASLLDDQLEDGEQLDRASKDRQEAAIRLASAVDEMLPALGMPDGKLVPVIALPVGSRRRNSRVPVD